VKEVIETIPKRVGGLVDTLGDLNVCSLQVWAADLFFSRTRKLGLPKGDARIEEWDKIRYSQYIPQTIAGFHRSIGVVLTVKCWLSNLPPSGKLRSVCAPVRFLPTGGIPLVSCGFLRASS
jgi:hypothetical protein